MSSAAAAAAVALQPTFGAWIPNSIPPGTSVASINLSGGDGNPISLGMTGDTTDFAISGSKIVVSKSGIAPGHCRAVYTVTVKATQK
jgi:hypothetical protein